MKHAIELKVENKTSLEDSKEVEKFKKRADKYKQEISKLKKSVKSKNKWLVKSAEALKKVDDDLRVPRVQIEELKAKL